MKMNLELEQPDIERWRTGNTGIEFITTIDSGKAGPHVMINSISHGNEISGAIAVDRLLTLSPTLKCGKLTLSFANVDAFFRFDPSDPHSNRFVDEDFNRLWSSETLESARDSCELRRARKMRPIIDQVDLLLDLHSMHDPHPPLLLSGPLEKGINFGKRLGMSATIVSDRVGHPNGKMLRDYGGFGDANSSKNCILIESGWHWERPSAHVAWQAVGRFLHTVDILDGHVLESTFPVTPSSSEQSVVIVSDRVIPKTEKFRLMPGLKGLDVLKKGDLIAMDGEQPIYAPFDDCVIVMPTLNHVKPGLPAVRLGRFKPM